MSVERLWPGGGEAANRPRRAGAAPHRSSWCDRPSGRRRLSPRAGRRRCPQGRAFPWPVPAAGRQPGSRWPQRHRRSPSRERRGRAQHDPVQKAGPVGIRPVGQGPPQPSRSSPLSSNPATTTRGCSARGPRPSVGLSVEALGGRAGAAPVWSAHEHAHASADNQRTRAGVGLIQQGRCPPVRRRAPPRSPHGRYHSSYSGSRSVPVRSSRKLVGAVLAGWKPTGRDVYGGRRGPPHSPRIRRQGGGRRRPRSLRRGRVRSGLAAVRFAG